MADRSKADRNKADQEEDDTKGAAAGAKSARRTVGDGIRQGIGVLSAFKDALEETIQEARERGDLSADKAKEVMKSALGKAQAAASDAREKFDFATHGDLESVQTTLEALNQRIAALEATVFGEGDDGPAEAEEGEAPRER